MRMNRLEWLAQFFRVRPKPRVKREKRERKTPPSWDVATPADGNCRVVAFTRSEARAMAKGQLGFTDRLPVGTVLSKVAA